MLNIFLLSSSEAVDALSSCAKDSSGRIIIADNGVAGTQTFTDEDGNTVKGPFNFKDGYLDRFYNSNFANHCSQEPDEYKVKFYQVSLCTEDPYKEDTNPDFSSCTTIFENTEGKDVVIIPNKETSLIEGAIKIGIGTYPYAAVIISNHLSVKHVQKYIEEDGDIPALYGNGDDGTNTGTNICYSRNIVTTYSGASNLTDGSGTANTYNASQGLGNGTIVASGSNDTLAQLGCTNSLATAKANADFSVEIFDHMGGDGTDHYFHYPYEAGGYEDPSAETGTSGIFLAANILKSDNLSIATAKTEGRRMGVFYKYDRPVRISERTISLKLRFTTFSSVSVDMGQDDDNKIWGAKVGADPFTVEFQTKTKRRRRSWR